jgi:hypothetical protein
MGVATAGPQRPRDSANRIVVHVTRPLIGPQTNRPIWSRCPERATASTKLIRRADAGLCSFAPHHHGGSEDDGSIVLTPTVRLRPPGSQRVRPVPRLGQRTNPASDVPMGVAVCTGIGCKSLESVMSGRSRATDCQAVFSLAEVLRTEAGAVVLLSGQVRDEFGGPAGLPVNTTREK